MKNKIRAFKIIFFPFTIKIHYQEKFKLQICHFAEKHLSLRNDLWIECMKEDGQRTYIHVTTYQERLSWRLKDIRERITKTDK